MLPGELRGDEGRSQAVERIRDWLLLDGSRVVVAGMTMALLFGTLLLFGRSEFAPFGSVQPLFYLFSSLLGGNLTLVTVVVSINQLLLSRELSTPRELRSQMEGVEEYRATVESGTGRIAPVKPHGFLRFLFEDMRRRTERLGERAASGTDPEVEHEIGVIVDHLTARADAVDVLLDRSDTSTFEVLSATLSTNYAEELMRLREIRAGSTDLPEGVDESIDDVIESLENIDIARQYFKSLYLEEELAVLSRLLFYVGFPSIVAVGSALLALTASDGASIPASHLSFVVPAVFVVGLLPLGVLFSFVLRIATVTERTSATLPFTTPD